MGTLGKAFEQLAAAIQKLRDPKRGCPWDLEQNHKTLKPYLIEESYETLDAIDSGDPGRLSEELGDVLLQVMLHSQIAADHSAFSVDDVIRKLTEKIIHRHPHVFGNATVASAQEVTENWEKLKRNEPQKTPGLLDGLPKAMPALLRCHRIGEKVARVGFDWDESGQVREKVLEELKEFLEAEAKPIQDAAHVKEEFGDMLFTLAQLARKMGLNAEEVVSEANDKFCARFSHMERLAGGSLDGKTTEELEGLWQEVKKLEKAKCASKSRV